MERKWLMMRGINGKTGKEEKAGYVEEKVLSL